MISENELRDLINDGKKCVDICEILKCSSTTVRRYARIYNITLPKGFNGVPNSVPGRPKGIPMSEEQKEFLREKFKGERNPFFGKKHSDETKDKMSKNHADFFGDNNPFKKSLENPIKKEEHKKRCRDIWNNRDEEYIKNFREKLSISVANSKFFEDKNFHKHHKSGFLNTKKAGKIFYRSSWEKKVAEFLDSSDDVDFFNLEPFCIKYNDDNINRHTRIDFYIVLKNDIKIIVEVKPKGLQKLPKNINKIKGIVDYCHIHNFQFCIIDETNINDLNNLILQIKMEKFNV
jgi:hypothetical protein